MPRSASSRLLATLICVALARCAEIPGKPESAFLYVFTAESGR